MPAAAGGRWIHCVLCLCIALAQGAAPAADDDPDPTRDEPLETDYYETATVRARPLASTTAAVMRLTVADLVTEG